MKLYSYFVAISVFISTSVFSQAPTLSCPSDIIVSTDAGVCEAIVTYIAPSCATNCTGATISQTDATGLTSGDAFPIDTTILEYTITSVGGSSTCTFMVIVQDNEAPTFVPPCPGDVIANSDPGICGAFVTYTRPKGIDACSSTPTFQTDGTGLSSGNIFPVGITAQSFECTDTYNNTATCNFTVTVNDVEAPTFSDCPTPQIFNSELGLCGATVSYTMPTGNDNCGTFTVTQVDASGLISGDFFPVGTTLQEFSIVDGVSITGTNCVIQIIVTDIEAPGITCPADQNQYSDNNCETILADYTSLAVTTDECSTSIVTVTQSPVPGTVLPSIGTEIITLTATDTSGNSADCTFNLIISDTVSPSITCPGTQNVSATSGCDAILGNYIGTTVTSDNCDSNPTITQSPVAGTAISSSQTVTMTSTDASGNSTSCSFLVIVDDPTAPVVTCPNNITDYVNGNCDFIVPDYTTIVVATDNCDPNPSIQQIPSPGATISGTGSQFISFSVSDVSGNISFCSFLLTLEDTLGPNIICPADFDVYLNNNCEYTLIDYTTLVTATDNCGGSVFLSQSPSAGSIVNGTDSPVSVTISAQDLLGNSSNCTFNLLLKDTIAPTITQCGNDTIVNSDNNCEYIVGDFTGFGAGTDNCSSSVSVSQSINAGDTLLAGGPYPITLYVSDDAGNTDSCSFTIEVKDIAAPTLTCPINPDVPANASCSYTIPAYDTTLNITDNCSGFTYTQSVVAGTTIFGIGTQQSIAIFVQDAIGNQNSCSFTITVVDTTAPSIVCPPDQEVDINGLCQYILPDFTSSGLVSDFCDGAPTITQSPNIGVTLTGLNVITLTGTDASGNVSTCTFNSLPKDTVAPTIICPNNISSCSSTISYTAPTGTDDCVTAVTTQTDASGLSSGASFPVGTTTLEYTTTDLVGNSSTCTFDITIFEPVTIYPGKDTTIEEGDSAFINATITNASSFIWSPDYNIDDITIEKPTVSPNVSKYYVISAESPDGCTATDSVLIAVNTINELIINNFLSPNGDQSNETWNVNKPALISGCWVGIYNRWGTQVWESDNYSNQWDGTNGNGDPLPEGTYYYIISCGNDAPIKGSVLLMR